MLRPILGVLSIFIAMSAVGADRLYKATVSRTLIDDRYYGGCMALVSPAPSTVGLNCPHSWVSFSCSGDFNAKSVGNQKFAAAQLALVTGTPIYIHIEDNKKHNSFCFAYRIDNLAN